MDLSLHSGLELVDVELIISEVELNRGFLVQTGFKLGDVYKDRFIEEILWAIEL